MYLYYPFYGVSKKKKDLNYINVIDVNDGKVRGGTF